MEDLKTPNKELAAFACVNSTFLQKGLTKREYFGGLAMQGLLANTNGGMKEGGNRVFSPDSISDLAIRHADALLEKLK
jgi:hypothetical protein